MAAIWTEDFNGYADGFVLSDSGSWTRNGTCALEALSGKFFQGSGGGVAGQHVRTGVATVDGEYLEATFDVKSAEGTFGVGVRMASDANTGYFLMHTPTQARLYVRNSGSWTNLQDVSRTLTTGALVLRLKVTGTSGDPVLEPLVNGSNPFGSNYTHNSGTRLTTLGQAGFYSDTNVSSTTGIHLDSATYEDGGGGGDTTPPTLSSPSGTGGVAVCSGSVSTNEGNGTLYAVVTASATAPTKAQVKAGQDHAGAAGLRVVSQAVSGTGVQNIASGAVTAGTRYFHFMHEDAAANQSDVASSTSFDVSAADTTAPILSSPVGTAVTKSTATVGATTDEANGTLYVVVTGSATPPSVAQIKAGDDHTGADAAYAANQAISSTGAKTFNVTGLTPGATYYAHLVHTDAATNNSNRVASAAFTTPIWGFDFDDPALDLKIGNFSGTQVGLGLSDTENWLLRIRNVNTGAEVHSATVATSSIGVLSRLQHASLDSAVYEITAQTTDTDPLARRIWSIIMETTTP